MDSYTFRVAGTSFHQAAVADVGVGDECLLIPEPDNPHDPNAVRIECGSSQIGHVPRDVSELVTQAIKAGAAMSLRIASKGEGGNSGNIGVMIQMDVIWSDA